MDARGWLLPLSFQNIWQCSLSTVGFFSRWPQQSLGSVGIFLLLETELLSSALCVAGRCLVQPSHPPEDCKWSGSFHSPLVLHFDCVVRWHLAGPFPLSGMCAKIGSTGFWTTKSQWFFSFPAFGKSSIRCLALSWFPHRGEIENFFPTTRYFVFLGYTLLHHLSKICPRMSSDILPPFSWDLFSCCRQSSGNFVETEAMFSKPGDCKNLFWVITDATGHMEQQRGLAPGL